MPPPAQQQPEAQPVDPGSQEQQQHQQQQQQQRAGSARSSRFGRGTTGGGGGAAAAAAVAAGPAAAAADAPSSAAAAAGQPAPFFASPAAKLPGDQLDDASRPDGGCARLHAQLWLRLATLTPLLPTVRADRGGGGSGGGGPAAAISLRRELAAAIPALLASPLVAVEPVDFFDVAEEDGGEGCATAATAAAAAAADAERQSLPERLLAVLQALHQGPWAAWLRGRLPGSAVLRLRGLATLPRAAADAAARELARAEARGALPLGDAARARLALGLGFSALPGGHGGWGDEALAEAEDEDDEDGGERLGAPPALWLLPGVVPGAEDGGGGVGVGGKRNRNDDHLTLPASRPLDAWLPLDAATGSSRAAAAGAAGVPLRLGRRRANARAFVGAAEALDAAGLARLPPPLVAAVFGGAGGG